MKLDASGYVDMLCGGDSPHRYMACNAFQKACVAPSNVSDLELALGYAEVPQL